MDFHPLVGQVFAHLRGKNVRWALLRLPAIPSAPTGDVDLLIHPDDLPRAGEVLVSCGLVALPHLGYGLDRFFVGYHRTSDSWLWLHLTAAVSFGPLQVFQTDAALPCLEHRMRQGSLELLAPEDAFWILLLHCLLDKGDIASHHRSRLRDLALAVPTDSHLPGLDWDLLAPDWPVQRVVATVREGDWQALEALAPLLALAWRERHPASRARLCCRRGARLLTKVLSVSRPVMWKRYIHRKRVENRANVTATRVCSSGGEMDEETISR